MNCPRCETDLSVRSLGDVAIHECRQCGGMFLPHGAIKRIIEDRAGNTLAVDLLSTVPRHPISTMPAPGQRMYVKCPTCGTLMNRKLFATGAGIVLDVCRADGAFFDAGELPAMVDFVMNGGLEVAASKDASRVLEARRHPPIAQAPQNVGAFYTPMTTIDFDAGAALIDLLASLFS